MAASRAEQLCHERVCGNQIRRVRLSNHLAARHQHSRVSQHVTAGNFGETSCHLTAQQCSAAKTAVGFCTEVHGVSNNVPWMAFVTSYVIVGTVVRSAMSTNMCRSLLLLLKVY